MNSHYATLGLPENATTADIKRAYRRLVLLTHPDRTSDFAAHRRFLAVNEAYDVLSHPARRAAYDAARHALPVRAPMTARQPGRPGPGISSRTSRRPVIRPRSAAVPIHIRYATEFARVLPWLRLIAGITLAGTLLILFDLLRAERLPNETIRHVEYFFSRHFNVSTDHSSFQATARVDLSENDLVDVYQTPWLGKVREVHVRSGEERGTWILVSRFIPAWLLGLVVLGSAARLLAVALRPDYAFSAGFLNCASAFFLSLYLLWQ